MKLFESITVGGVELKNKIVFPPTVTMRADMEGHVTEDMKNFYLRIAKGGAGLVLMEATFVTRQPRLLGIYDESCVPRLKDLVDRVHSETDAKIGIQLCEYNPGPIDIDEIPIELIEYYNYNFINAAVRAKEIGFDFVEIHAAHGVLISNLLSLRNKRKDEYGKNLEGRMKLLKSVITGCMEQCDDYFPVGVRINGDEFIVGGNTIQQTTKIAPKLAELGIAYLSVSAGAKHHDGWHITGTSRVMPYPKPGPWKDGTGYSGHRCVPPAYMPDGVNVYLAEAIKNSIQDYNVPVITAGKIPTAEFAESILQDEKADMIAICRPILCDAQWPNKSYEGRTEEILKCAYCVKCMEAARLGRTSCIKWKTEDY